MTSEPLRPQPEGAAKIRTRWRSYAETLVAHRRAVWAVWFVLSVISTVLASRLPLESDFAHLLPPSASSVQQLKLLEKRTSVPSTFLIGLESDDPAALARAAEALRTRLAKLPPELVDAAIYDDGAPRRFAWQHRFLYASLHDLEAARDALEDRIQQHNPFAIQIDDDPAPEGESRALDDLRRRLDEARNLAESPKRTISKDGRLELVVVRSPVSAGDHASADRVLAAVTRTLDEVRADVGPAVTVGMTGDAVTSVAETKALLEGMVLSTVVTVVLVVVALLLFHRSALGVGALFTSLFAGTLVTFGFTKLAIGHLNVASAFLSSIVIGNGINFGILMLSRYLEERRRGAQGVDSIASAMANTAPGTVAAAVAAAAAYGSLVSTPFRGFRHFGIIGGAGMLLCWLSAYTLLPTLLYVFEAKIRVSEEPRLGLWLGKLVARNPWPIVALGALCFLAVTGATLRFLTHEPLEDNLRNLRSSSKDIDASVHWMARFDKEFGNGIDGGFVIATPDRNAATAVAKRLHAVDDGKTLADRTFSHVATIDDALPADQAKKLIVLGEIRRMMDKTLLARANEKERADLLELRPPDGLRPLADADIPRDLALPFTERDGTRGRLVLANTGLGTDTWSVKSVERFASTVRALDLGPDVLVGGDAFVFSDMIEAMRRDGPRATLLSALGALLVVLLTVGWGRFAVVTMLCGALGTLALMAAAQLIGLKVNFLDFVALPITIGIGIDYAVNIAARARLSGSSGRIAVEKTGAAVLVCSYTTIVGYASLLFSANKGIRTFGLSAMIGEFTCITAALVFAPALVDAFARLLAPKAKPAPEG